MGSTPKYAVSQFRRLDNLEPSLRMLEIVHGDSRLTAGFIFIDERAACDYRDVLGHPIPRSGAALIAGFSRALGEYLKEGGS